MNVAGQLRDGIGNGYANVVQRLTGYLERPVHQILPASGDLLDGPPVGQAVDEHVMHARHEPSDGERPVTRHASGQRVTESAAIGQAARGW